ncbi:MAG: hypothetical protein ACLTKE_09440 [Coprococcus sp.]
MQKAWKKKSAVYVPFVVLFLVELWIHKGIVPDFGDDLWFKEVACSEGFSFLTWLHQRYMEWSSPYSDRIASYDYSKSAVIFLENRGFRSDHLCGNIFIQNGNSKDRRQYLY